MPRAVKMYDNIIKSYTALSRASDTACVFSLWVSFVGVKMSLKIKNKKKSKKKTKKTQKKTDDNRTRDDRVRLTVAYDYMKAARGVVSFSRLPSRSFTTSGRGIPRGGRATNGWRGNAQVPVGPSESRSRGHDGRRHQSEHAPRACARPSGARRALFAGIFIADATAIFHDLLLPPGRPRVSWDIMCVQCVYGFAKLVHDPPPPGPLLFRFLYRFLFFFFFQDTPYSKNRTFVWLRGFLRFSPPKCFIRSAFNAHSIPTRGLYSYMTWCCYPLCSWLIPGLRFC